jgi:hypothetical protein
MCATLSLNSLVAMVGLPVFIYATINNEMLGAKAKFMLFILLPIPVALYIPVVTIGSTLFGLGYGFFYPINLTFVSDRSLQMPQRRST